jgi:CheY-like chemotaxis protein
MLAILLVDDDQDTWAAVRLALEPRVKVHTINSLHSALGFLRTRSQEVCGVIVDLNLTEGSDNFGRVLLERLREMAMPCVVFSKSIRSLADAQRYENEFGVLGTIGKGGAREQGKYPLQQLRDSVERMILASLQQLRARARAEVEYELARRDAEIEQERHRSEELVAETMRVAGKAAATKLAKAESTRIQELVTGAKSLREEIMDRIEKAETMEDLEHLRTDSLRALGAL